MTIDRRSLHSEAWTVTSGRTGSVPAVVPGDVHRALMNAGIIEHPDIGFHERDLAWIGRADWSFTCSFEATETELAHDRIELVADRLDTIARITLNGDHVGDATNAHHPHRFDVGDSIRPGTNQLTIAFRGPLAWAEEQAARLGDRPVNGDWGPYAFIRKPACDFGWDWGPCAPSISVGALRLERWSGARIAGVRPSCTHADAHEARVDIQIDVERIDEPRTSNAPPNPLIAEATLTAPDGTAIIGTTRIERGRGAITLTVRHPERWWPIGLGGQPLYSVAVALHGGPSNASMDEAPPLDHWHGRIGLRTVRLDTTPDRLGAAFTMEVNGRPLFCRGANWIPNGLVSETASARIRERLMHARDANMNMLRVWGGGRYEDASFYDLCDELGMLVWQDFMFACAVYPEEAPYPTLIEAEARHQVTRLSRHPSIVLWCGGNENIMAVEGWGWREEIGPDARWGGRYYFDLLANVTAELDPTRPYWPDSPYTESAPRSPNDANRGDRHTWDQRVEEYRALIPRFVSEFGHQSPPNFSTLRAAVGDDALQIGSEALSHRQRAWGGDARQYDEPIAARFAPPATFDAWHYLAQLLQARALTIGVEWLRARQPTCMGALIWQLNDCWTGHSWSIIDVAGRPKPAWYAMRRAMDPWLITIQPDGDRLGLYVVNEDVDDRRAALSVRRVDFDGRVLASDNVACDAPAGTSRRALDLTTRLGEPTDPTRELIVVDDDTGHRATWFFDTDRALAYPDPRLTAELDGPEAVRITAGSLIRDLVINVDRLDGALQLSDQLLTLLPGESIRLTVDGGACPTPDLLTTAPVFNCANRHGRPT